MLRQLIDTTETYEKFLHEVADAIREHLIENSIDELDDLVTADEVSSIVNSAAEKVSKIEERLK